MGGARVDGGADRHFGVYPAIVTNVVDPESLGRIEIKLPWLGREAGGQTVRAWATLLSPYADNRQGIQILPEVGTQVVVAFEAGDLRRPYIVGSCWNGKEALPEAPVAANDKRLWRTRAGSLLEFDDDATAAKVTLSMKSGHKLVMDDEAQQVTLAHANGCTITLDVSGEVRISANTSVEIRAAELNVHCATANFDGLITCQTLVAETGVVSPSYTPGAGNLL
jgi:uncharacterized protein involved in type VI secretion and phage assembly